MSMTEQEVSDRYPGARIERTTHGFLVDRYPLVPAADHVTQAQWMALTDIAREGWRVYYDRRRLVPVRTLAQYGLVEIVDDPRFTDAVATARLLPAGKDYAEGHFRHGYIPD